MTDSQIEFSGMKQWEGRTALVTGCSSGIGAVIAKDLLRYGANVIGCARNIDPINVLSQECLKGGFKGKLTAYNCGVGHPKDIQEMFQKIEANGGVDICISNAGTSSFTPLLDITGEKMAAMLNLNITGLVLCSNLSVKSMLRRNVNDGHNINISRIEDGNFRKRKQDKSDSLEDNIVLRKQLTVFLLLPVSVTFDFLSWQISPGRVETNFHVNLFGDAEKGREFYQSVENLTLRDVSDATLHVLSTAENCQVYDIHLQPTSLGSTTAYTDIAKK